ncbi:MarR family winged helix-turn-helix transcriptional regulator [Falsiroseomonas sp. HC035]|uniref:MarR family winged helix-turn-helix transcriptional regulator n=1 Tax=Falsiroseomonas sp. HC035 TaxID=3390999 RepID=UPI003D312410
MTADPAAKLPFEDSIGFLVRDLNRAIQRDLQSRIAAHGVPPGAWYFLRVLWEEDGLTQRELAQRVGMREPTAVIALRGMEAAGWLRRERSAEDRRKVHLFLTAQGHALREALMPAAHAVNAQAAEGVDVPAFIALLRQVRANFAADG